MKIHLYNNLTRTHKWILQQLLLCKLLLADRQSKARAYANSNKNLSNDNFNRAILKTAELLAENGQKQKPDKPEDYDSLFCQSLARRLRKLSQQSKAMLRVQIEQLFLQTEFLCACTPLQQVDYNTSYNGQSISNVVPQNDNTNFQL